MTESTTSGRKPGLIRNAYNWTMGNASKPHACAPGTHASSSTTVIASARVMALIL